MLRFLKRIAGGADEDNAFKRWKLNQPIWKQFLIEASAYLIIGMIFIPISNI